MKLQRRTFFKSIALAAGALFAPRTAVGQISPLPALKPVLGNKAFTTTVIGKRSEVKHNLGSAIVFVVAATETGEFRSPMVEVLDRDTVRLRFEEPGIFWKRKRTYRVVISCQKEGYIDHVCRVAACDDVKLPRYIPACSNCAALIDSPRCPKCGTLHSTYGTFPVLL
jgi:hypothetical protein